MRYTIDHMIRPLKNCTLHPGLIALDRKSEDDPIDKDEGLLGVC